MGTGTALITGASGGIGEALAYRFAKNGYDLILVARSEDKLDAVARAADLFEVKSTVISLDLQAAGAGATLEAAVADKGLVVDVLVNNAGYGATGAVTAGDLDEQLGMIDLNCRMLTELSIRFRPGDQGARQGGRAQRRLHRRLPARSLHGGLLRLQSLRALPVGSDEPGVQRLRRPRHRALSRPGEDRIPGTGGVRLQHGPQQTAHGDGGSRWRVSATRALRGRGRW